MMLTCSNCHAQLEDGALFCDSCGAKVEAPVTKPPVASTLYCPNCGYKNSEDSPFCSNCGKPMVESVFCPECGQQVSSDEPVCPGCSAKLYEAVFCPDCGKPSNPNAAFCKSCGRSFHATETVPDNTAKDTTGSNPKPGGKSKKGLLFAGIGVAIAAALVAVFVFLGKGSGASSNNCAMYVKDKEIFYNGFSKNDPWQVTSRFVTDFENYELASGADEISNLCQLSKDGSLLFFPDRLSYSDDGFSLYYRKVNKPKEEAVKIDSNVGFVGYSVSDDASYITYVKNDTLYQYDRKKDDKQKIASDVVRYYVSDNGKTILYLNEEQVLYETVRGGDRNKIDSDIANLCYVSDDLSIVFYIKDGTLYKKESGKDKDKISSDVAAVITAYDSGEVYFVKADEEEFSLMDFVDDDLKKSDDALREPTYPGWGASDAEYDAYQEAYNEYNAKRERDYVRDMLKSESTSWTSYTLCYYDGKDESIVSDTFAYNDYTCAREKPVITYTTRSQSEDIEVKMSDAESPYDLSNMIEEKLFYSEGERYVAVGSTSALLDEEETSSFRISPDGQTLYYMAEVPVDKNYGELYQVSISSSGELGKPKLYDSDVYINYFRTMEDGKISYLKDYKDGKGELYLDGKKIDYDVYSRSINYDKDTGSITYFIDWNSEKDYGTLKKYTKKESEKISDDVHDYYVLPNGNILYLNDYSQKSSKGDLYLWNKKDAEKIDEDVVCILPIR